MNAKNRDSNPYYDSIVSKIRGKEREIDWLMAMKNNKRFKNNSKSIDEQIEDKRKEIRELQALIGARQ